MEIFLTELETYMYNIVEVCTSLLEFFGIAVLVTSAVLASFDGYGVTARISVSTSRRA
ncbi:hypothetical protein [Porcincola intestinalis]|uniref:hypothetical protein n=1 Tax=Porcincola intestinalis TaxID=2606632 RepID=UPI002E25F73E